ncbi:Bro-N domain-containing protein [Bacillus paranthracis]|uniref:BRO-N domain-containing protein n=1 Tax=Bacillus cereus group TaxID=86661 RepID=UPI00254D06D0|nr:Bro-N domain-containing protein [Bacillus paranthracis]
MKNEELGQVRTVTIGKEHWFRAKDVCDGLDIKNPTQAIQKLDEDERIMFNIGRQGSTNVINESDLYLLIMTSRKPQAEQFEKWVTEEVLPTIRKTGGYVNSEKLFVNTYLAHADDATKMLFKSTL